MIRAIFWDNDGVLVDTERFYFEATRRVMAEAGVDLRPEQYVEFFMVQSIGAWHLAVERGVPREDIPVMKRKRNAVYSDLLASSNVLIPGVDGVLMTLSGKYVMGVVTGSRREHFNLIHRSTGLLPFFDFVLAAEDYGRYKPDPEPCRIALERSGFPAGECLAIEDSERGLTAAVAAGIRCVVIPGGTDQIPRRLRRSRSLLHNGFVHRLQQAVQGIGFLQKRIPLLADDFPL